MVFRILMLSLLMSAAAVRGEAARQSCVSCHSAHYEERGRCSDCHYGNPASERKNIAHAGLRAGKFIKFTLGDEVQEKERQQAIAQLACRRCHVSSGRGNRIAVSLDRSSQQKTVGELARSIRAPVAAMPNFGLGEEQVILLVNAVLSGADGRQTAEVVPVKVHFKNSEKKSADIFSTKCGSCHRILSERLGAVGTGDVAPNLSGLFSEFYPKTYKTGEVWTASNLGLWLKNPRAARPWARMLPVVLTAREEQELQSIVFITPQSGR